MHLPVGTTLASYIVLLPFSCYLYVIAFISIQLFIFMEMTKFMAYIISTYNKYD